MVINSYLECIQHSSVNSTLSLLSTFGCKLSVSCYLQTTGGPTQHINHVLAQFARKVAVYFLLQL